MDRLGKVRLRRILRQADVPHCEPIEKIADEYIALIGLEKGSYDNVAGCKYTVPDYRSIGSVYTRIIEDTENEDLIDALIAVYHSRLSRYISDYNSALYFQPRDYLREQYRLELSETA